MFDKENKADLKSLFGYEPKPTETIITSLNRYERKKDIPLALKAVAGLKEKATLVVAGGYDERVIENVEHHLELVNLAKRLGINVVFLRSISSEAKVALLKRTNILLYTP
jgi:alpha-1,3/alpha-1,6-mannosyltransferase